MLDLGADIAATAEQLVEFAIMGQAFARVVNGVANPRVALLNIGSEELKGHESIREAARLVRGCKLDMDFRGYIEADKIGFGEVDVIVTDGFTGNIALKTAEGIAKMISEMLKEALKSGPLSMAGALLAMPALNKFRSRMDPRKVNGAVFLGLNGVVVKSHGGTDGEGFEQAIAVAAGMGESHFREEVAENLKRLTASVAAIAASAPATSEQAAK
jgi:glycerol-3-phosphate acyltransferase PlsX